MRYFSHDTTAGSDDKIVALRLECGGAAVDAYWVIIEQIYEHETALDVFGNQHKTNPVIHRLCIDKNTFETYVNAMLEIGLLKRCENDGNCVISPRIEQNIDDYKKKAETARQNGKTGGRKPRKKPKQNQRETESVPTSDADSKLTKSKRDMGFDKQNPISPARVGAAAADAAPPLAGFAVTSVKCGYHKGTSMLRDPDGELICPKCHPEAMLENGRVAHG